MKKRIIKHKKSWVYQLELPLLPRPCRVTGTYYASPPVCGETSYVAELACHEPP